MYPTKPFKAHSNITPCPLKKVSFKLAPPILHIDFLFTVPAHKDNKVYCICMYMYMYTPKHLWSWQIYDFTPFKKFVEEGKFFLLDFQFGRTRRKRTIF